MDDELQVLEAELRRLRPQPPSAALADRLRRELQPASSPVAAAGLDRSAAPRGLAPFRPARGLRRFRPSPWWWLALPAAAAVAFLLNTHGPESATPRPASVAGAPLPVAGDTMKPVAAQNVLYAAADEGLVTLDDGTPARRERLHFVDTITWRNPRTNASLTWSVPREEVRLVPVNFQ